MTFIQQGADAETWTGLAEPVSESNASNVAAQSADADRNVHMLAHNRRLALLSRVVEAEILPRLALVRSGQPPDAVTLAAADVTTENDTSELVGHLLGASETGAWTFIELLELRGATPATLYLGVVTQAARRLGELWQDDRCDFAQVTISLGRLQQIVRALSPEFQKAAINRSTHAETALLLPTPGEQHTIGLVILGEFFQREGWRVIGGPVSIGIDAAETVRDEWVDVAGFSIGSRAKLDGLTTMIRAVRRASRNRYIGVMVGGPLFLDRPDLVNRVGADTTAPDAPSAVRQAKLLLNMRAAAS
ncbi:MAG TPA: cobalamin B12-binding domain-containing protein [Rhodopila sp.]|nr:cobalamin B12-binding domain-containing protein [Rhodopila sp.]